MKTILILISATLLSLNLTSCRKKHTVTLQAQNLLNPSDGSHYAGMKYGILEKGYFISHKANAVASGQLDANGRAVIDVKLKKSLQYVLGIEKPDNVCYTEITLEYPIEYNEPNNITFNYAPCGWVNVPYKNINCEGPDDKMQYKFYYTDNPDVYTYTGFTSGNGSSWSNVWLVEGCADYIGDFYSQVPAGKYTFEWRVIRPSGTTTGIDYFTVTEGDTLTYVLEY